MYEKHPVFEPPDDENIKIWRYLDIPKFLWLIEKKSLYFSRCDLLGDPFEGSLPSSSNQVIFKAYDKKEYAKLFKIDEKDDPEPPSSQILWRNDCYICSFHMNEHESAALWSIYARAKQGVAIQTTFKKLVDSLKSYKISPVFIGKMKYIDYTRETIDLSNSFLPILYKRKSFEHERELRAVSMPIDELYVPVSPERKERKPNPPEGVSIPIDVDCFIERIYLAPTTKSWIKELLEAIIKKNGIEKPLEQSGLDATPIF